MALEKLATYSLGMGVFLMSFSVAVYAQSTPASPSTSSSTTYSAQPYVIEKIICKVDFENDGASLREDTSRIRIQSAAVVEDWGLITFGYSAANQEAEVRYVRVLKPDGSIVTTPPADVQDVTDEVSREAPVYSDYHEKHIPVKGLSPGDVLEYQYIVRTKKPLVPGQFWFQYDFNTIATVLDQELELSVPKKREVIVKSRTVQPTMLSAGNRKIYAWKTSNLATHVDDEFPWPAPPPAVQVTSFKSWEEVGEWWNDLEQSQMAITPEIRAKAAELTRGAASENEKLKAIYDYVATQFRYISISFGIGRYQPHSASQVLNNQYGDCKDKHTLFATLLKAVGIQAFPALMSAGREVDPDVPSPGQFDHVISVIPLGEDQMWADTTAEVAPIGYLASDLRGKAALLVSTSAPASLVETPATLPFVGFQTVDVDGTIKPDGTIECNVHRTSRGDTEVGLRQSLNETPKPEWKDVVQFIAYGEAYGGDVSNVKATPPQDTDTPLSYSYEFTAKDKTDWDYKRIILQVPVLGLPTLEDNGKQRKNPIQLGSPRKVTINVKIKLPPGFTPKLLPAQDLVRGFAEYHSSYGFNDGILTITRSLVVKTKQLPASNFKDYNSFRSAISLDSRAYTYLYTPAESEATLPPSPESAQLYQQARDAIQAGDLQSARDLIQRGLKVDPQYAAGWLALGSIQFRLNEIGDATTDFRKAADLNPHDPMARKALAECHTLSGSPDAAQSWRDVLKLQPNDREAHLTLGTILLNQKKFSEASLELEAAVKAGPATAHLEEQLAKAHLETGNDTRATQALEQAVQIDPSPDNLNKVAEDLADHQLDLAAAQRYAEKAVQAVENKATLIKLDALDRSDVTCMVYLAKFWGTLGWIYLQQHNFEKAEAYLNSAWNLQPDNVAAYRLGQIYEKKGEIQSAVAAYASAMADVVPGDRSQARARLSNLVKSSSAAALAIAAAKERLKRMHRVKLGKLSTKPVSADFWVLISKGGKVQDIRFIQGDKDLQAATQRLASLTFTSPLPDAVPVKLLRRGALVCLGERFGCDFTLLDPGTAGWPGSVVQTRTVLQSN